MIFHLDQMLDCVEILVVIILQGIIADQEKKMVVGQVNVLYLIVSARNTFDMKPIQTSGWYHVSGEKVEHHFMRETMISACGKVNARKLFVNLVNAHYDYIDLDRKCKDCEIAIEASKKQQLTILNPIETYYTKSTCPDCDEDCVIISSKPVLQDKVHIHVGCPASD